MKISYFIFLGFLLILLLFCITTYLHFRQAEKVNENSDFLERSSTVVRQGNRFQRNILNMVSGLRGYLLTGENYFIQTYDSAAAENGEILAEISGMIDPGTPQEAAFNEIARLNDAWITQFARPLIAAKKAAPGSDSSRMAFNNLYRDKLVLGQEKNINRALQQKFREFSDYEYELRNTRRQALAASIDQTRSVSFYLITISVLLGGGIAFFLAYRLSTNILSMVKMSESIAAGNYEVSTRETGVDELSQLAHSLNNMARMLSENINLLKRKNEELDQFAHIVSHDLKAPLRGIDNVITWIEEDHTEELPPKVGEYVALIKQRVTRAESLIKGILSYARVGRESQVIEDVDLNVLFDEIRENVVLPNGLQLRIPDSLPTILTERLPLQQILANLIQNAITYHDKPDGHVSVGFSVLPDHYEFSVEDNGPGIAPHYHDKIFMVFQTLHEQNHVESTGIGLAIVKKILDDRKQNIKVMSEPGRGSVFVFTWPKYARNG